MSDDEDPGSHSLIISGRDNIQDLIDSSVPDSAKVTEGPISLKKLCERVINSLPVPPAIKVIEKVFGLLDFTEDELESAGSAEKCMEYLVNFARKRQVYLVPDGSGNLLIFRPDTSNKASEPLINRIGSSTNNVKKSFVTRSQQNRFRKILCRSQDNFGVDPFADSDGEGTDRNDKAEDGQIRATRYLEIQAEETMTKEECEERAKEEVNIRRAMGQPYTAIVAGNSQSDGTVWDFGQFVQIDDEVKGVTGEHLIKSVEYSVSLPPIGTRTRMVCVQSDAYQVIAEPTAATKRKSTTAPSLENEVPKLQEQSVRQ
jgi:prophage tail gpP-like protein